MEELHARIEGGVGTKESRGAESLHSPRTRTPHANPLGAVMAVHVLVLVGSQADHFDRERDRVNRYGQ